jgi:hypothetical protein
MKRLPWVIVSRTIFASLLIGLACGSASAATAVYKCLDRNLGLVYTDISCKGGELMDIRAGDADPAAVARLERERDALDRSSAQRISDMRHAELQRQQLATAPGYAPDYDTAGYDDATGYFPYGYGYGSVAGVAKNRHRFPQAHPDRRNMRQSVVPARTSPLLR